MSEKRVTDGGLEDPYCNPRQPHKVTFEEIKKAAVLIRDGVRLTRCAPSQLSNLVKMDVFLKNEFRQQTGSFKERGARNALLNLSDSEKRLGVIASSLGNHSQGLSFHASELGIPCTVIMPVTAPLMKIKKCQGYGANVIIRGNDMTEARNIALSIGQEKSLTFINGYDHPHVIAGQGTIGLEICDQVKDIDAIVVPVGGGGLLAGISTAVKAINPNIKIIGVESDKAPSFTAALKSGSPRLTPVAPSLADGLAVPLVGYNAFVSAASNVDKMVVVSEKWIALAVLKFIEIEKSVIEGGGAIGLAAILAGKLDEFRGKRVVLVLTGGNIDTPVFGKCIDRGLVAEARLMTFQVVISDKPGGLAALCTLLGDMGVSIRDVSQNERVWVDDIHSAKVKVICETRDAEHANELKTQLNSHYKVDFIDLPLNEN